MINPKILIISERGDSQAQFLRECLSEAGYEIWLADQGEAASDGAGYRLMIRKVIPNLVILDWGLRNLNGLGIIQAIRRDDPAMTLPILVVGTEMEEDEILIALEAGADLCLTERLHPKVLVARVQALLRRSKPGAGS